MDAVLHTAHYSVIDFFAYNFDLVLSIIKQFKNIMVYGKK